MKTTENFLGLENRITEENFQVTENRGVPVEGVGEIKARIFRCAHREGKQKVRAVYLIFEL